MVHIRTLMDAVAENIEIDEGRMKDIFTANQEGKSAKEIAKALKLPLGTVKKILGEEKEDITEFTDSQLDVLARQYAGLKGKTISIDNANKLRKIFDRIPDRSLDALRRKKIPFLSGLALSRMVQKGMPVKEDYVVKYQHYKTSKMMAAAYKDKKDAEKFRDSVLKQGGKAILTTRAAFGGRVKEDLKEAKYTINYEVESDSGADDRYVGNNDMTVNAFSPKDAVKKFGQELNKTVKQAQARGSRSILSVYMNYIEKDGNEISDREVDKLNDYASDFIYKGVYDSYMKEARWQIEGQLSYDGIRNQDGFHMVINANSEQDAENKAYKELDKARDRKKIGPGGGGSVEDVDIESIEKTNDRLQAPSTYMVSQKEAFKVQINHKDGGKLIAPGTYKTKADAEKFIKWYKTGDTRNTKSIEIIKEKKSAFRLSYSDRYGKHAGFEDADTLADLQNKAANLRKKGFKIDKMGRNTSPIKEEDDQQSKDQVKSLKVKLDKEKDTDALEKQLTAAQGQINILKQKLENEKNKVVKPEPNRETGEVPLTIGVAHKYLKDKQEKEMKKEEVDNYPTSDINKKKHAAYKDPKSGERKPVYTHEGAKLVYETIKGLKNKAEKSGMPYSILKKVYDRGMAAWRGGHRPGTSQQQWAFARVNSFVTKSSGTWGGADKDLAKQVRGSKK